LHEMLPERVLIKHEHFNSNTKLRRWFCVQEHMAKYATNRGGQKARGNAEKA
jgi:hypothetical protein